MTFGVSFGSSVRRQHRMFECVDTFVCEGCGVVCCWVFSQTSEEEIVMVVLRRKVLFSFLVPDTLCYVSL